jgi:hypothetical protein
MAVEPQSLQQRVEALEREVAELRKLVRPVNAKEEFRELLDRMANSGLGDVMDAAVAEREKDRRRARKKWSS